MDDMVTPKLAGKCWMDSSDTFACIKHCSIWCDTGYEWHPDFIKY